MAELRRWALTPSHPLALQIAADARLSQTDYTDDQVWELVLGGGDESALQLKTRYGGRVGLASLVPMWIVDKRPVYQYQAYASPPVITAFAPAYLEAHADITPKLKLRAEYWAADSHAISARFSLKNTSTETIEIRLDLVGFLAAAGKEVKLKAVNRLTGENALSFGRVGDISPIVMLSGGQPQEGSNSKLSISYKLKAGSGIAFRWVHVGLPNVNDSIAAAEKLIDANWARQSKKIVDLSATLPKIETGDIATDATIAFAYQQLAQSVLRPTMSMPFASIVASRQPDRGWSMRGDGTDHIRSWSGQNPTLAYLSALALASVDAVKAQGIIHNYLATQQPDGFIDWKPGLAGQKSKLLCMPILARLAWGIFQYTEDEHFLREVFPSLLKFIGHWLKADHDTDKDWVFEWQQEAQTGYPFMPTFAAGLSYGQNADIRYIESPDLAAYLLSEVNALKAIAIYLHDAENEAKLNKLVETLNAKLDSLWHEDRYSYRERDTHQIAKGISLLDKGRGDEEHLLAFILDDPSRLIVNVIGGVDHIPKVTVTVEGIDQNGTRQRETIHADAFKWSSGHGSYTTTNIFKAVERVRAEGLSRVYKLSVATIDTTHRDINGLLPIWSVGITPQRAAALNRQITDHEHFWSRNGVTMISMQDDSFSAAKTGEGGGIWAYWVTLIGEGLIEYDYMAQATDLLKNLLRAQTEVLKNQKAFYAFYHTEQAQGLGEVGSTAGIVPLHLLLRVLGVRIISPRKVWVGGTFAWGSPVKITQHDVQVERSPKGTKIQFASGHRVTLPADTPMQEVVDPTALPEVSSPPKTKRRKKET